MLAELQHLYVDVVGNFHISFSICVWLLVCVWLCVCVAVFVCVCVTLSLCFCLFLSLSFFCLFLVLGDPVSLTEG